MTFSNGKLMMDHKGFVKMGKNCNFLGVPQFRKNILFWYNGRTDRRTNPKRTIAILESPKYMLTDVSDETLEPPET